MAARIHAAMATDLKAKRMNVLLLAKLVRMNYRLRGLKILPDKWYWADRMLFENGYNFEGKLNGNG